MRQLRTSRSRPVLFAAVVILPLLHPLGGSVAASSPAEHITAGPAEVTRASDDAAAVWVARVFMGALWDWASGEAVGWGIQKLLGLGNSTLSDLSDLQTTPAIPEADRAELAEVVASIQRIMLVLREHEAAEEEARQQILAMEKVVAGLEERLTTLEDRLTVLESQQALQLKRVEALETQVAAVDRRVTRVEDVVFVDPDRFLRHEAYLSGQLLYGNAPAAAEEEKTGFAGTVQYNFTQRVGVGAALLMTPLHPVGIDIAAVEPEAELEWSLMTVALGPNLQMFPPRWPVSLQLGVAAGFTHSSLSYLPAGADPEDAEARQSLDGATRLAGMASAEVGVAPPGFSFEPIISAGLVKMVDDVSGEFSHQQSAIGDQVWYVSLGVRFRQYLRGTAAPSTGT